MNQQARTRTRIESQIADGRETVSEKGKKPHIHGAKRGKPEQQNILIECSAHEIAAFTKNERCQKI